MYTTPPPDPVPCVSFHEFWNTDYPLTKHEVERLWEVRGTFIATDGRHVEYRYPKCGKPDADLTDDQGPHVTVIYTFRSRLNEYMEWM